VALKREGGSDVIAAHMTPGQYFGEISLLHDRRTAASVRAIPEAEVEVLALDRETFINLVQESQAFHDTISSIAQSRLANNQAKLEQSENPGE
jgi:CRP-like cAMP-binding protein